MDKFCGKCGSVFDSTGRCPNCNGVNNPNNGDDNKNKKLLTLLIIAISCAILIISIFATIVFRDIFSRDKTEETQAQTVEATQSSTVLETEEETEEVEETEEPAQGTKKKDKKSSTKKEVSSDVEQTSTQGYYDQIIKTYKNTYPWSNMVDEGVVTFYAGEFHSMYNLDTLGYAYMDLDGNGVDELLIGPVEEKEGTEGNVYEIYTIVNGEPYQLAQSWSRCRHMILSDNTVLNSGSSGACLSSSDKKKISADKKSLCVVEKIAYDGFYAEEIGLISDAFDSSGNICFKSTSDDYSDYVHITEEEARTTVDSWKAMAIDIDYTPLSRY